MRHCGSALALIVALAACGEVTSTVSDAAAPGGDGGTDPRLDAGSMPSIDAGTPRLDAAPPGCTTADFETPPLGDDERECADPATFDGLIFSAGMGVDVCRQRLPVVDTHAVALGEGNTVLTLPAESISIHVIVYGVDSQLDVLNEDFSAVLFSTTIMLSETFALDLGVPTSRIGLRASGGVAIESITYCTP